MLAYLREQRGGSLGQLVDELGVSKMTVHRDLALLEKRGLVRRVFGAALPVDVPDEERDPAPPSGAAERPSCLMCLRPTSDHLRYSISLESGTQQFACCPHCGLAAQLMSQQAVVSAMVADYLSGMPHPAQRSWYLLGSAAAPCCRPSVLAFAEHDMAARFRDGFGGDLLPHTEALAHLRHMMAG
jgi:DNA-binding transcriptional regulator LsrR (DeoR family)